MGLPTGEPVHARSGDESHRQPDRRQAPSRRAQRKGLAAGLTAALLLAAGPALPDSLRIATWHVELTRKGPGLLLRDILEGRGEDVAAVVEGVAAIGPDILLLTGIDWDRDGHALAALAERLSKAGQTYPHRHAPRPNAGLATTLDLDGDGRAGTARDAQGYGRFPGQGGMALLSRLPLAPGRGRDFTALVWRDLPGAKLPVVEGAPFPSAKAQAIQRLSSTGHWDVPVALPGGGELRILAFAATPPVFDGPEDRNGLRNADEIGLWQRYLDGALGPPPDEPVVVLGNANLDPTDGQGRHGTIRALLEHPRLTDPKPASPGGAAAARAQAGANATQRGPPALDTADWADDPGPGNLRVSYVLPDRRLKIRDAGVLWPMPETPLARRLRPMRHHLVWVEIGLP